MNSTVVNPAATSMRRPLKIGLLLDSEDIDAWFYQMISDLMTADYAEVSLVILNDNERVEQVNDTLVKKLSNNRGRIGYLAIRKVLEEIYGRLIERTTYLRDAEASVSSGDLLNDIPSIKVKTQQGQWSDRFFDADIETIKSADLDVLIRGGFGILRGDILKASRYGEKLEC